jgi:hypothetical protein
LRKIGVNDRDKPRIAEAEAANRDKFAEGFSNAVFA